ncbi:MAG: efflux RND transporter periplasmic adaptor subunit [Planctomycetes bacterium]|nr:efflux RND transporter periplasmic adaptor subunit [Planctomycetota bacterium]
MIRKYVLPVIAAFGLCFAVYVVGLGSRPMPAAPPVAEPSMAPWPSYVAGAGIIEASTENIAIGTVMPGVVTAVYVKPGQTVKAGDPLFKVDDRPMLAELQVRQAALAQAKANLERLERMPRPEDIPVAEARLTEAESLLADARSQMAMFDRVDDKRAVSQDELDRRRYAVRVAEARLNAARAQLALLKAGTWKPDIEIARAEVAAAEAQVQSTRTEIERLTTRALVDGDILQVKIRLGEYAPAGVLQTPLVLMGNLDRLHVRVDVDENDAWRIRAGADARAFVRGNRNLETPLTFVRIEPYVVPKRSLTGESVERVDTRVLQVIYSFERSKLPVYVGQLMDVYIEAPPVGNTTATSATRATGP